VIDSLPGLLLGAWPWLLAWGAAGFVGGAWVGRRRNRWILGPLLGALLGPLGWWWVWRLPPRLRECPACSRPISSTATTCRHCGADVNRFAQRSARASMKSADRGGGW
jgi:predicted nucleic acid-binding Zn ribbon protein